MIELKKTNHTKEGAYSFVFFPTSSTAIKVFKCRTDASREHIENVFNSEIEAYGIATSNPELKNLVPNFYDKVKCEKIEDESGNDISINFHLDLAYKMEKIEGIFKKIGPLPSKLKDPLITLFKSAGIKHVIDSSVILNNKNQITCVIDFAVKEYELYH